MATASNLMQFPLVQIRRSSPSLSLKTPKELGWVDLVSHEISESTSFCLVFYFIYFIYFFPFSFNLFKIFLQFIFQFIFLLFFYGFSCIVFTGCAKIMKQGDPEKNSQEILQWLRNFAGILHYEISQEFHSTFCKGSENS